MSYDFYAEFWNEGEIDEYIKRFMTETWEEIWNNRNSKLTKKKRIFEQRAIKNLLKGFYVQSTQAEPSNSPIHFVKFLKETELYIQRKKRYFDEFSKNNLKKYVENRQYYPKLPDELAKGSYIEIFKHYPISDEIKGLIDSFDFNRYLQRSILPSHTLFLSISTFGESPRASLLPSQNARFITGKSRI
jgi:hypothetical protein